METMDYDDALARIFEHVEKDQIERAVMGCIRVARSTRDYLSAAIFLRELHPGRNELIRALYDDTSHLKEEARKFIWEKSSERWLDTHTLDFALAGDDDVDENDKRNVLKIAIGEIDPELEQWERSIEDMTVPQGMTPFDVAAFTERFTCEKAGMRLRMKALQTIKSRVKARCFNYATQMERQLSSQRRSQGFLDAVQNEVNNFFKARSDDVFQKLQKAVQLSTSTDLEDASLLLTEVRRALKAAADYFFPPITGKVACADGIVRALGQEQYLNRLQEFLAVRLERSTATDLLLAELEHLTAFTRRLNEVASKGVHASATIGESRQGLVGLYFFLFNVCQHLSQKEDIAGEGSPVSPSEPQGP